MSELLRYLKRFNRKERFFLVGWALGNAKFKLSESFRADLGKALGLAVPEDAFVAMDYHLDWLYASLCLHGSGGGKGPHCNDGKLIRAQQEDIDLVVAYQDGDAHHIVLLEAKGATSWTNKQMRSKAIRLREIFGETGRLWQSITPHFMIASPMMPEQLEFDEWPTWMAPDGQAAWIELPMPDDLQRVTRCKATGAITYAGDHWRVVPDRGRYARVLDRCDRVHRKADSISANVESASHG